MSISRGKGKPEGLRASPHSLECNGNALRSQGTEINRTRAGPPQVGLWEGKQHTALLGYFGLFAFSPSDPWGASLLGGSNCTASICKNTPANRIPGPPPSLCEQHSFLALVVDPACRVLSPQEYSPFTKQDHKAVT